MELGYNEVWSGFKQLLPISMFVVVFGLAFGLAAAQVGLCLLYTSPSPRD